MEHNLQANLEDAPINLDINEIKCHLPHRYPMLLIDRIEELRPGEGAVGIKNVTVNEYFFQGHFPTKPIMPGVMIVEAMGQTAAVVVSKTMNLEKKNGLVYFMSMDNVRFRRLVEPGDVLRLYVKKDRCRENVWRFTGKAYVDQSLVAEATFTAMVVVS
ncbi:MAG: 3-hydroxyacyl-ACP dehydratase FabZ [Holosporaceae bacterium]|jgi:3-hydroxyacyl-[acyl-carrier-protein] dehydratase|nr:3-hydroxyacyl-ACP dehydratase FabZ [Holosporaceae bacterium]